MTGAVQIAELLRRADALRGPPTAEGPAGHKEWLHFCVYGGTVDALVNFSLVDALDATAPRGTRLARVTVLTREGGSWDGDVDLHPEADVRAAAGAIDLRFGDCRVTFDGEAYTVVARLARRDISVHLRLTPLAFPSVAHNVRLDEGPPIHWLVVPRLRAEGSVRVGRRTHAIRDALAYHDHNWGRFAWGRDFAWEWGYGLPARPEVPWSVVCVRLGNRARSRAYKQAIFLWKGPYQHRVLHSDELEVRHEGLLRPARVLKLPRPMALVLPGEATDVPETFIVRGGAEGDALECVFRGEEVAQVIIPNDHDPGVTVIHEVSGRLAVRGSVRGEDVALEGHAIFEFLGA